MMLRWLRSYFLPCPPRVARERFLLPTEWARIRSILESMPIKVRVYFTLLVLLGCRRDELRRAQWHQIDLQAAIWHKPKGKNGKRQILPLAPQAVQLFSELPRSGLYVFVGDVTKHGRPDQAWSATAVKYWWRKIRWEAGCPDVRIHDLRRTTGSWLTMSGENLKVVQSVLDHRSLRTTEVYSRLDLGTIKTALERHAARVSQ